jgi:hypothetical protein
MTVPPETNPAEQLENARVGYQAAIDLWINQGSQGWARFNVMLVVNTIIIASIGFAGASQQQQPLLKFLLPIAGFLICAVWFILIRRESAYSDYWVMCARELEEKHLSDPVEIISRGGRFAEGDIVNIEITGQSTEWQMNPLARALRARAAADWMVVILAILYIAIIAQGLL